MNRIILIGNGFDLAHDLKTSYDDFLNYYWEQVIDNVNQNLNVGYEGNGIKILRGIGNKCVGQSYSHLVNSAAQVACKIQFTNSFLKIIMESKSLNNWVDIEDVYYRELVKRMNNSPKSINSLNKQFEEIKLALKDYLSTINFKVNSEKTEHIRNSIESHIFTPFNFKDFIEDAVSDKAERELKLVNSYSENPEKFKDNEYLFNLSRRIPGATNKKAAITDLLLSNNSELYFDLIPDNIYLLDFNYTNTTTNYIEKVFFDFSLNKARKINCEINHIHGSLNPKHNNPIIFGFGDELDDNYPAIEKLNNNDFLENIKSIRYSDTDNYKKLLQFVNSDQYQICIFGHSCGVSDRTMLNTLFEHENCVSIKPYYHLRENGTDNYSDIVRNISRNFNNKASMRDKVVNKTYCEPLVRPEKNG